MERVVRPSSVSKFGYPEVRRGLVAAMVMPHLLRHVGERNARYLLLTGELLDAQEAAQTGLINAVVPSADQLLDRAMAWARALAEGGPNALATTKSLLQQFSRQAVSVEETAKASAAPRLSEEARLGLEAFLNKMYRDDPDFVFTVTRDFVRSCQTPVLILPDDVPSHPYAVAMEAARLAPNAEVSIYPWKEPPSLIPEAVRQVRQFLHAHTPVPASA